MRNRLAAALAAATLLVVGVTAAAADPPAPIKKMWLLADGSTARQPYLGGPQSVYLGTET